MADATVYSIGVFRASEGQLRCVLKWAECIYLRQSSRGDVTDRYTELFALCDQNGLREFL
jgi:hypothetical protein